MTYDDEDSLVKAVQRFEERALIEVYDRYNSAIYRYAFRLTGDQSLTEECVSETFLRFLKSVKQGKRINTRLQAYLYRIAHNYIVDIYRAKVNLNNDNIDDVEVADTRIETVQESVEKRIEIERIRKSMIALTYDQQQAVYLNVFEGYSVQEIAQFMGKPAGVVKALLHRGLKNLRNRITKW